MQNLIDNEDPSPNEYISIHGSKNTMEEGMQRQ